MSAAHEEAAKRWDEAALALDQGRDAGFTIGEMLYASPEAGREYQKAINSLDYATEIRLLWPAIRSSPFLAYAREAAISAAADEMIRREREKKRFMVGRDHATGEQLWCPIRRVVDEMDDGPSDQEMQDTNARISEIEDENRR